MIRCPNCSSQAVAGALFCDVCGSRLRADMDPDQTRVVHSIDQPPSESPEVDPDAEVQPTSTGADDPGLITLHFVETGQVLPLSGSEEFTLGRVSAGQPLIPEVDLGPYNAYELGVSRLHAVIGIEDDQVRITDLGSANGTRVNGVRIPPHTHHELVHGDLITLGSLKIRALIRTAE